MDAADDAAAATTAATIDTAKSLARIDTTVLYPPFVAKLRPLVDACASRSRLYVAIKGERSYAEQAKLYAIGRTTDKQGNPITPDSPAHGHFVTKAPPGTSPHNFNVAVDFSLDSDSDLSNGLQPDDVDEHYRVLAEEAQKLGLDVVPIIGRGTLRVMVERARQGFQSMWGQFLAEGIVARPAVELRTRSGHRLITKIKHKDFAP